MLVNAPTFLTTNYVSHCMIATHLLNSDPNPFSRVRVINKDYRASNFLATPVPDLLVSSIVTRYSSPTLIGFFGDFDPPKRSLFFSYLS